jgi:hypothetical protein
LSLPAYTTRFYQGHAVSSDLFTVPPGFIWVVSTFITFFPGGVVDGAAQVVNTANDATIFDINGVTTILGQWQVESGVRCVCEPGEVYLVTGLGSPDITICGYALSELG